MLKKLALAFTLVGSAQITLASTFDDAVLADEPVLYLPLWGRHAEPSSPDITGGGHHGAYRPAGWVPRQTRMPNGDGATVFDGSGGFVEVSSVASLSVATTGVLTVEAWIRPDTLQFTRQEGDGYVHWAGKGEVGAFEYALRMYSLENGAVPPRPNRISGYAFNLIGGLGSGSYFQDSVVRGRWIYVAMVINTLNRSHDFPTGYVRIYKDGILRKTTALDQFHVVPESGSAPLRIGTRDLHSFFQGAIGKFAVYNYELNAIQLQSRVRAMAQTIQ